VEDNKIIFVNLNSMVKNHMVGLLRAHLNDSLCTVNIDLSMHSVVLESCTEMGEGKNIGHMSKTREFIHSYAVKVLNQTYPL
jgi:hypothetical protein